MIPSFNLAVSIRWCGIVWPDSYRLLHRVVFAMTLDPMDWIQTTEFHWLAQRLRCGCRHDLRASCWHVEGKWESRERAELEGQKSTMNGLTKHGNMSWQPKSSRCRSWLGRRSPSNTPTEQINRWMAVVGCTFSWLDLDNNTWYRNGPSMILIGKHLLLVGKCNERYELNLYCILNLRKHVKNIA